MYIITQRRCFLYNKELHIYATSVVEKDASGEAKDGAKIDSDKITITLFSYVSTIDVIQKHVEKVKNEYLDAIEKSRNKKRFIYSLCTTNTDKDDGDCWREYEFESTRTFSNMFFEEKESVLKKINFFINNKQWYYDNGIPYSIGFGLHGPPGTGKTSFFKCLANLTGRHLVVISLKLIKTKRQLEDFFFENKYNEDNKKNSIGFDKKIIIFEDIDCIGDIVLKRDSKTNKKKRSKISNNDSIGNVLQKLVDNDDSSTEDMVMKIPTKEPPLTLDDILNLWDGLKETPGRMLGISSNHYDKLDPALIRPGRIDVTIHLNNTTRDIIQEMFTHYYKISIDPTKLNRIKNEFYSPAEIINCYVLYKDKPNKFIERLMQNKRF
jgi:chaperone BCS1